MTTILTNTAPRENVLCRLSTATAWESLYTQLSNEIQLRHYSPNTLNSYAGWVRKFSNFTEYKDPHQVTIYRTAPLLQRRRQTTDREQFLHWIYLQGEGKHGRWDK